MNTAWVPAAFLILASWKAPPWGLGTSRHMEMRRSHNLKDFAPLANPVQFSSVVNSEREAPLANEVR